MKLPITRTSFFLNLVIIIFSLFVSWFTLLMGSAHLIGGIIEGRNPDLPYSEHILGVAFCVGLCLVGIVFLLIAIGSIRGIIYKNKAKQHD